MVSFAKKSWGPQVRSQSLVSMFVLLGLICVVLLLSRFQDTPNVRLAREICSTHVDDDLIETTSKVLNELLLGSEFENRCAVNSEPLNDFINVYVFDSKSYRLPVEFATLKGNCAFVGKPNLIVVDAELLNILWDRLEPYRLIQENGTTGRPTPDDLKNVLRWVLGHEIGHIILGHGPAHFRSSNLLGPSSKNSIDSKEELDADRVFVELIANAGDEWNTFHVMSSWLNREISLHNGVEGFGPGIPLLVDPVEIKKMFREKGHPEYLIRIIRMMDSYDGPLDDNEEHLREAVDFLSSSLRNE